MNPEIDFERPSDIVNYLSDNLKNIGFKGTGFEISKLLCVNLQTVSNWRQNRHKPDVRHTTRIGILVRLIIRAKSGEADAYYTLRKMAAKGAPKVLALGRDGFMAVSGLSWSMPFFDEQGGANTES
ncbi:MAG: hypothetical protein NUW37_06240 [Planctomycetes bacterium]|nr:hypothetical protein [Planctomycetota bacterium]